MKAYRISLVIGFPYGDAILFGDIFADWHHFFMLYSNIVLFANPRNIRFVFVLVAFICSILHFHSTLCVWNYLAFDFSNVAALLDNKKINNNPFRKNKLFNKSTRTMSVNTLSFLHASALFHTSLKK